jgi:hypothetical protein
MLESETTALSEPREMRHGWLEDGERCRVGEISSNSFRELSAWEGRK